MKTGTLFHDRIANGLTALDSVSETLGPARMGRCQQLSIHGVFHDDTSQGGVVIEFSWHQDFPDIPIQLDTLVWAAPGQTFVIEVDPKYWGGFVRARVTTAVDGSGVSMWAQGRR